MMQQVLFVAVPSAVTGLLAWFLNRKKSEVELIENAIKIWRELAQQQEERARQLAEKIEKMEATIEEMKQELHAWRTGKKRVKYETDM